MKSNTFLASPSVATVFASPLALALALRAGLPAVAAEAPAAKPDSVVQLESMVVEGRSTHLVGQADSSSEGFVGKAELAARPFLRRGELLEIVPGVVITQHSGSGKANQYFLRGFNLDHGTDFATSVDGMPVNLRTHAHGQGYSDLNFIVPEFVQSVAYQKGTHSVENGDFSAAGAAQFRLTDAFDQPFLRTELGENDYARAVGGQTFRSGKTAATSVGFETFYENGPWQLPEHSKRFNGLVRQTWSGDAGQFALTALGYHGKWTASDQIPARAVDDGRLDRFGYVDPTCGGSSDRASLSLGWSRPQENGTLTANAYAIFYRLNLFSNFTGYLDAPDNGDQFNQRDRRWILGGDVARTWTAQLAGRKVDFAAGLQVREDIIEVGLRHTADRQLVSVVREDDVKEGSAGVYARGTMQVTDWFRAQAGLRGDFYDFDVASDNPLNSGHRTAAIASPKLNVVFGPWQKTEIYAGGGLGFHSNDARGTVINVSPATGESVNRDTPLARTKGAEIGVRTAAVPGLVSTVSFWLLDLDSELVFVGDAGDTEATGPTRRYGVEIANFYQPTPWLALDLDLSLTRARYRDDSAGGRYIANSIDRVVTGGIVLGRQQGFYGSLRGRYFGSQPLVEDNSVRAPSSHVFNARLGWRSQSWEFAVDVLNVFNRQSYDIAYYYTSRLPGESDDGVDDIHFHPAEKRTVRVSATKRF